MKMKTHTRIRPCNHTNNSTLRCITINLIVNMKRFPRRGNTRATIEKELKGGLFFRKPIAKRHKMIINLTLRYI